MNAAEKQAEIDQGKRIRCLAPFCRRTCRLEPAEAEAQTAGRVIYEWLCGKHYRGADKALRDEYAALRRQLKRDGFNPNSDRSYIAKWRLIKDQALSKFQE